MINVVILNSHAFIWNLDDACKVREECRIVGSLVGCLPRAPSQNVQLGLPMQLLPEEATLMFEKGFATPVEECDIKEKPSKEQVKQYENFMIQHYEEQAEICKVERREEMVALKEKIIEGKMKKRNKMLEQRKAAGEEVDDAEFEEKIDFDVNTIRIDTIPKSSMLVQTFIDSPWPDIMKPAEWKFPQTTAEKHRYQIFKDLWEQGNYLTSGSKFGGDFLVYPGDPHLFHSFYIAVCMPYQEEFCALDLISKGRLGANVKKTVALCCVDNDCIVKYTSLQWTGMR
ncbi:tRNA-splicing endonuclease subunit Sen34-like [Lineus longissimus]|uniref:tRNA-splicing endonuclease subunit Sen34-like n=1 Tax=Lineus longissimus TaxID=88925 RepID=UPI00315CC5D4